MSGRLLVKYIKSPSSRKYVVTRMGGDCTFSLLCEGTGPYGCVGILALHLLGSSVCSLNNFCSSLGCVSVTVSSSVWPMLMPKNESARLGIERQFVVSFHTYHELVDVNKLALAKDECIVDKQDNEGDFLLCDLVEQAVVLMTYPSPMSASR